MFRVAVLRLETVNAQGLAIRVAMVVCHGGYGRLTRLNIEGIGMADV